MENWQAFIALLENGLGEAETLLADLPRGLLIAGLIVPVVLAVISRRVIALLAILCLTALAAVIVTRPAYMATAVAIDSYVGSLLIALLALWSMWKDRTIKAELAELRVELKALAQAEERRLLMELRAGEDAAKVGPGTPAPSSLATVRIGSTQPA
jgi:hypothetical protein